MRSQLPPAQLAKAALQRLAQARLEPTPENYARAYAIEAGGEPAPAASGAVPERAQQLMSKLISLALPSGSTRQELQTSLREQRFEELQRQVDRLLDVAGPGAQAEALAQAVERLVRGLERGLEFIASERVVHDHGVTALRKFHHRFVFVFSLCFRLGQCGGMRSIANISDG